jgi:hypothetical protein
MYIELKTYRKKKLHECYPQLKISMIQKINSGC